MTEIIEEPFDWNDNFSEIAQEDFSMIQKSLSYGVASSIGMALAKLELLEKQGCKVVEPTCDTCKYNTATFMPCNACDNKSLFEPKESEEV